MLKLKNIYKMISSVVMAGGLMLGSSQAWGAASCPNRVVTKLSVFKNGNVNAHYSDGTEFKLICNLVSTLNTITPAACAQRVKTHEMSLLTGKKLTLVYAGTTTSCPTGSWEDVTVPAWDLNEVTISN